MSVVSFALAVVFIINRFLSSSLDTFPQISTHITDWQGRTQGGVLGLKPLLELDILQKLFYLRKRD